jgi:hypothetical protein
MFGTLPAENREKNMEFCILYGRCDVRWRIFSFKERHLTTEKHKELNPGKILFIRRAWHQRRCGKQVLICKYMQKQG